MPFETTVVEAFETLTQEQQKEVVDFIMYLKTKDKAQTQESKFPFDVFSGDLTYIAKDFDETPECFKEVLA